MKDLIAKLLKQALKKNNVDLKEKEIIALIEIPKSTEMGDYAFPCFSLAKQLRQAPDKIASKLKDQIKKIPSEFQDINVLGPYINFFVDRNSLAENLVKEILKKKDNFGKIDIGKGKSIN